MLWEEASLLGPGVLAGRHEVLSCEATHAHIPKPSAGFRLLLAGKGDRYHPIDARFGGGGLPKSQPRGGLVRPQSHPLSPHHSQSTGRGLWLRLWPHRRPLRISASAARAFISPTAFVLRAGAGRRSGSAGWRQGRVRWGRPLLSRPRGAVGSGPAPADVEPATVSAVAWSCGGVSLPRWVWMVVRFVCVFRVPVCAPACPVRVPCVSRLPPGVFLPVPDLGIGRSDGRRRLQHTSAI